MLNTKLAYNVGLFPSDNICASQAECLGTHRHREQTPKIKNFILSDSTVLSLIKLQSFYKYSSNKLHYQDKFCSLQSTHTLTHDSSLMYNTTDAV